MGKILASVVLDKLGQLGLDGLCGPVRPKRRLGWARVGRSQLHARPLATEQEGVVTDVCAFIANP